METNAGLSSGFNSDLYGLLRSELPLPNANYASLRKGPQDLQIPNPEISGIGGVVVGVMCVNVFSSLLGVALETEY